MAPSRADLVVGVEGLFTWDWRADRCTPEGSALVLGHARSLKAIHGGTATHDKSAAHQMAVRLRGGRLPPADVDPADRRATRDLRRRRLHLRRQRAELRAPMPTTNRQENLPEISTQLAYQAHRAGVAARCPAPAVPQRLDVALALIDADDRRRTAVDRSLVHTAKAHDAPTCSRRRSIPGVGTIRRLVILSEIDDSHRCPRGQACVSDGRLVTGAQASAGTRDGTSGPQMGPADRTWAVSAAAVVGLRPHPAAPTSRTRVAKQPGTGPALTVRAPT